MRSAEVESAIYEYFDIRQQVLVSNIYWGLGFLHELDIAKVNKKSNYLTEIEIKVSKADILADKKKDKWQRAGSYNPFGDNKICEMYFAVPVELEDFAMLHIPKDCGLYAVEYMPKSGNYRVKKVRGSKRNREARKLTDSEYVKFLELGCMRVVKHIRRAK